MQMFQVAWDIWYYAAAGVFVGLIPTIVAIFYVNRIEKENDELKGLLILSSAKMQKFLDARRKGAHITNSRRKKQ